MLPRDLSYGGVASATTAAGGVGAAQPQPRVDPAAAHLRLETIADYV